MGQLLEIVTPLHTQTNRLYIERMQDEKVLCMKKAKEYEFDYWDGDRRFGYGGYKFIDGRWAPVAEALIKHYNLSNNSKILDVGCGKAFLLYEITKILPGIQVVGLDISKHAIANAKEEIRGNLLLHPAQETYPFNDNEFDLVISLACLHNLLIFDLCSALKEMTRVSKNQYLMVESYRNEQELFNLECWALTAECFFNPAEWKWLFQQFGYSGDYEFIYFEECNEIQSSSINRESQTAERI